MIKVVMTRLAFASSPRSTCSSARKRQKKWRTRTTFGTRTWFELDGARVELTTIRSASEHPRYAVSITW
jgi:hypothetical protein